MLDYHLKLSTSWDETREKIKEANPDITDDMLNYQPGKDEELLERLLPFFKNKDMKSIQDWIESISANSAKAG
jgi:hypothetical protein